MDGFASTEELDDMFQFDEEVNEQEFDRLSLRNQYDVNAALVEEEDDDEEKIQENINENEQGDVNEKIPYEDRNRTTNSPIRMETMREQFIAPAKTTYSRSMPSQKGMFLSKNANQKWRMKYMSALKMSSLEGLSAAEIKQNQARINLINKVQQQDRSEPMVVPKRKLQTCARELQSAPIPVPIHYQTEEGHTLTFEHDDERSNNHNSTTAMDGWRDDDIQFIPPHQMVDRGCFSLGMQHHFRQKPGNI